MRGGGEDLLNIEVLLKSILIEQPLTCGVWCDIHSCQTLVDKEYFSFGYLDENKIKPLINRVYDIGCL